MYNLKFQILFNRNRKTIAARGGAIILRVGVLLLQAKGAEKFWGCTPYMTFWGYNSCKEIQRAYWTVLPRNMLATIFLTGHAFIGL